jgi:membrane protease YdiL (CAAX protease family)
MNQLTQFLKRYSLIIGIILMFALTWPIDLANSGALPFKVPSVVALLVGYGFVCASLIMTGLTLGKEGVTALLKRFLQWRVGWKWYLALFIIPFLDFIGISMSAALTHAPIDFSAAYAYKIFGPSANLLFFVIPFLLIDVLTNGEEIGWRGYALPRLQVKYSGLAAALILGAVWGFWHLPKFLSHWNTITFAWFLVDTMAKSVLLTWLYNNTKGSLLLTTLGHAIWNTAGVFLPTATTVTNANSGAFIVTVLLEVLVAVMITVIAGPERLSRTEPKQVEEDILQSAEAAFPIGPLEKAAK